MDWRTDYEARKRGVIVTYPPDATMFTLLGFHLRERVVILDGQPVLRIVQPGYMSNAVYQMSLGFVVVPAGNAAMSGVAVLEGGE